MSDEAKFWLEWIINALIAAGTVGAVLVALFGEWIKARWFPPKLVLSMPQPEGVATPVVIRSPVEVDAQGARLVAARYYHVTVSNRATWQKATQVQVFVIQIEERAPDGGFSISWTGEIPLQWSLQEIQPIVRDVGRPAVCNLCSVVKDKWLELLPMIQTLNFVARRRKADSEASRDFVVTLQARAAEGVSPPLRLRISWDGEWADGDLEMKRHLVIREFPSN